MRIPFSHTPNYDPASPHSKLQQNSPSRTHAHDDTTHHTEQTPCCSLFPMPITPAVVCYTAICTATFIGNERRIERYAAIRAEHGSSLGIRLNAVSDVVMTIIKR
eukprot:scaffold18409_cov149-Skeletonema_dohrnii-CCMP3373.AAC.1